MKLIEDDMIEGVDYFNYHITDAVRTQVMEQSTRIGVRIQVRKQVSGRVWDQVRIQVWNPLELQLQ
jgi:hypothetical protein